MDFHLVVTLSVLVVAVYLFVTEKLPVDVVALAVLCTLLAAHVVTPREALSGFASQATITVAAMFVLSAALQRSGVVDAFGAQLARIRWPTLLAAATMVVAALLSAFVNNTAVVAIFLPVVATAAVRNGQAPSKFLVPLSYAAQMGGVCTLVGTSTNLLVDSLARDAGQGGFGIFEFAPLGLWFVAVGVGYVLLLRGVLLPDRDHAAHSAPGAHARYGVELTVGEGSHAIGDTAGSLVGDKYSDLVVREVRRDRAPLPDPRGTPLAQGDRLLVYGAWDQVGELAADRRLSFDAVARDLEGDRSAARLHAEVMVGPRSSQVGKTLGTSRFGHIYRVRVLGLHKATGVLRSSPQHTPLSVGDILMVEATQEALDSLAADPGYVQLSSRDKPRVDIRKALLSVLILAAAISAAALGWLPIVAAALIGCGLLVVTQCLTPDEAYAAVDWRVVVLLAGLLPLGIALEKTGASAWLAAHTLGQMSQWGPLVMLAAVYLFTAVLTEVMSNNAAAVLVVPIAIAAADQLGVDAKPFLVAVAFAASTSFATPVGYQTNTMVYTAGGYRFTDFPKFGIPLNLLFWGMAVYLIPRYFPF